MDIFVNGFHAVTQGKEDGSGDFTTLRAHAAFDAPPSGGECGSCYGAEESPDECCNTCDSVNNLVLPCLPLAQEPSLQVREAYRRRGWAFVNSDGIVQVVVDLWVCRIC